MLECEIIIIIPEFYNNQNEEFMHKINTCLLQKFKCPPRELIARGHGAPPPPKKNHKKEGKNKENQEIVININLSVYHLMAKKLSHTYF